MRCNVFTLPLLLALAIPPCLHAGAAASAPSAAPAAKSAPATAPASAASDTVDQKRVHAEYGDGNFETVVQILEDYRSRHEHYRPVDSVFIAKYLGVVYASNPDSREKGKYWLYKMLQMEPGSDLVDLYVGEEVERTFEKVRQEFVVRRNYRGINDTRLAKAVETDSPAKKKDTVVMKDTVVVKGDNWISPITDGTKFAYSEVKGGIKAGIQSGYVPIEEEKVKDDSRWTGNINVGGGLKFLNKEEWETISGITDQTEIRVATDLRQRKWPINIALDASYAFAPEVLQELSRTGVTVIAKQAIVTYEVNFGVRKIFDFKLYSVRPFFGGGFSRITTQWDLTYDDTTESFREGKLGVWVNGGVYWEMDRHFNLGMEYLFSNARIDLYGKRNHGGHHIDMIAGFHF
ncbi:MAG: hypothetical protein JWP91_3980 [Fibrobacteres bacterium]|nr:hypothetical protein [Fibrobacterota bacterium]